MIPKSMPSGFDPMGGNRFSEKIMLQDGRWTMIRFNLIGSWSRIPGLGLSGMTKGALHDRPRLGRGPRSDRRRTLLRHGAGAAWPRQTQRMARRYNRLRQKVPRILDQQTRGDGARGR